MTSFGDEQCSKAEPIAHELKVHTVFVSPLRRALQTMHEIFKNHPDFDDINFVLMPKLREHMHTSNDIPINIEEVVDQFSNVFPKFDTSELENYKDPKHWFVEDLNKELRDMVASKFATKEGDPINSNAFDILVDHFKEIFPERSESVRNTFNRGEYVRSKIRQLLDSGEVPKDHKIVV